MEYEVNKMSFPHAGVARAEMTLRVFNPDGRGIELIIPHILLDEPGQLLIYLNEAPESKTDPVLSLSEKPLPKLRKTLTLMLKDGEMLPEGIVETFILKLIDPEGASNGS